MKLKISIASYNEIAAALEKHGVKVNELPELTLEKNIHVLEHPIDFRLATMRRDAAGIAAQVCKTEDILAFLGFTEAIYAYVLNGDNIGKKQEEWK